MTRGPAMRRPGGRRRSARHPSHSIKGGLGPQTTVPPTIRLVHQVEYSETQGVKPETMLCPVALRSF